MRYNKIKHLQLLKSVPKNNEFLINQYFHFSLFYLSYFISIQTNTNYHKFCRYFGTPFKMSQDQFNLNWDTYSDRQMELIYTFIEIWYPDYPESLEQFESNIIRLHEAIESYLTDDDENSEAEEFSNKVLAAADQRVYREAVKKKNMN